MIEIMVGQKTKKLISDDMVFNKKEVAIISACDIESTLLVDFYKKAFPKRLNSLKLNWKWLNRTDFFSNKTPLVLVYQNQVIAHSGLIPFKLSLYGDLHTAAWYIDFKILQEYQRQGLGNILTQEWMKFSEINVTFCNEKSIGVFKKLGWLESFDTYLHLNFILPFNHPGFVRKLPTFFRKTLNYLFSPISFLIYKRHSYSTNSYNLEMLNEQSFNTFFESYIKTRQRHENTISPNRDKDYAKWRVLDSPNRDRYYVYKTEKFSALVSLHNNHGEYIDVLWVSDINNKSEIKRMICTLGVYGLKNGFAYIRFYTSKKDLSDYIKKKTRSVVRHPRFAYFSQIEPIFNKVKTANWDFELIDSDFEHIK